MTQRNNSPKIKTFYGCRLKLMIAITAEAFDSTWSNIALYLSENELQKRKKKKYIDAITIRTFYRVLRPINVSKADIILLVENPKYRGIQFQAGDLPGINKRSTIQEARSLQLSSSATKFQVAG